MTETKSNMNDNNKLFELIGEVRTDVSWIKEDARKKNGYIDDLNERTTNTEKIIIEFKNAMEKTFDFMNDQKSDRIKREGFIGRIKADWLIYTFTTLTGMGLGTYLPLLWMYIKKMLR